MKRKHFEASVCRESDQHDWRWFISWQEDDEWESFLFDATPKGLQYARLSILYGPDHTREIMEAYFHACDLNATIHRLDAA